MRWRRRQTPRTLLCSAASRATSRENPDAGRRLRSVIERRQRAVTTARNRREDQGRVSSTTVGYGILGVLWLIAMVLWPYVVAEPPGPEAPIATPSDSTPTPDAFATIQAQTSALPTPTLLPSPSPTPVLILRRTHVVEPGDTFQAMAEQYNSSVALLAMR